MDKVLKKPLIITGVLVAVLIICLIILGSIHQNRGTLILLTILIFIALIALVWFRHFQQNQSSSIEEKPKKETIIEQEAEETTTRTGQTCAVTGSYYCSEHEEMSVEMEEGKRFPPCRGDGVGHSAVWVLKE
jgi:ABC-type transport system involved in cytochrome bd biosynthesis fused ATPase/permease subunit